MDDLGKIPEIFVTFARLLKALICELKGREYGEP
jgi:hypothetical protein